jgi:iron complex transport system ATP-binding protein
MTLACINLTLAVPGRILCRGLTLSIEPGQVWGVLGANGSGKSTLIHALAGIGTDTRNEVVVEQVALHTLAAKSRARSVGVVLQHEESAFHGSVLDYVLLGRFPHASGWMSWGRDDEISALAALKQAGVAGFAQRQYATLSGGERQRVRIAQLIAQSPRYWLLDEPLQHLDLAHQVQIMALVAHIAKEEQRAVVMVLHDLIWPARICTHALLMYDNGTTAAGAVGDVLTRSNLESLFGCALQTIDDGNGAAAFVPAL